MAIIGCLNINNEDEKRCAGCEFDPEDRLNDCIDFRMDNDRILIFDVAFESDCGSCDARRDSE